MLYEAKVENNILILPEEIVKQYKICSGDTVSFKDLGDGSVELIFSKQETVDIDLSDEEALALMKMAHEKDVTFNQFVNDILRQAMKSM